MTAHASPEFRPARLRALAKLPVFFDLAERRVVVIGGGKPAIWKTELLLAAGALVDLYAAEPEPDLLALAETGRLTAHLRPWQEADLDGAALVVADLEDETEAGRLRQVCRRRGTALNVIDRPTLCDFQFGTIVNRSPVVVGIMTDGAAPILAQAIRRRVEAVLPASLAGWARVAKSFRVRLKALLPDRAEQRAFWERFVDKAFAEPTRENDDRRGTLELLAGEVARGGVTGTRIGSVAIVGAGPGDPELLTLKAMRELQAADVIVYDRLVTPEVLELGRREARRIHVGKEGHGAACRQDDISALLVDLAFAGERVVRLKGGDPAIFGRTGEEVAACREAGVPVRIVPGITAASAAAACLDLSLTHRDLAGRVQFVTGHDRRGDLPGDLDLGALADRRSTVVIYMGRRTAARLAAGLLAHGLPADTPVVAVSDVSRPSQAVTVADLRGLADGLALPDRAPVVILIGSALGDASRPSAGQRIGVTSEVRRSKGPATHVMA